MRALNLDFARTRLPTAWWQWLLLLGAAGLSAILLINYRSYVKDINQLEREIRLADAPGAGTKSSPKMDAQTAKTVRSANQILERLHMPWETLFRDIELAQISEIALLAIEPNAERSTVMIEGEARNSSAILAYIGELEDQAALAEVRLVSHEIRQEDAEKPVRFIVTAQWVKL